MDKHIIYRHIFPNGKSYIGQCQGGTIEDARKRWRRGKGYVEQPVYRAIKKYGWDNIQHEIIAVVYTQDMADMLEKLYIQADDTTNPKRGYNISIGGSSNNQGKNCHSKEYMKTQHNKWISKPGNREKILEYMKQYDESRRNDPEHKAYQVSRNKSYYESHKDDPDYKAYHKQKLKEYYERKKLSK